MPDTFTSCAIVLAAGRGSRMRRADDRAQLTAAQRAAAEYGSKAMLPIQRPFIDYLLSALADAGIADVCLVVAPDSFAIREHLTAVSPPSRVRLQFVVQEEARGTANALLTAESFALEQFARRERNENLNRTVLVLNSDNYYPVDAFRALRAEPHAAVVGFEPAALLAGSNFTESRLAAFAMLQVSDDGLLEDIVEKPGPEEAARALSHSLIGMNLWSVTTAIFDACRRVLPSQRGELELPQAVRLAVREMGVRMRVVRMAAGVLDLTERGDVAAVARQLQGVTPRS